MCHSEYMMTQAKQKPQRPRDVNVLAFSLVKEATAEAKASHDTKDIRRIVSGREGGRKGGKARAQALTPERRRQIARRAAFARWKTAKQD
jgi:hypothetical protein